MNRKERRAQQSKNKKTKKEVSSVRYKARPWVPNWIKNLIEPFLTP